MSASLFTCHHQKKSFVNGTQVPSHHSSSPIIFLHSMLVFNEHFNRNLDDVVRLSNELVRVGGLVRISNEPVRVVNKSLSTTLAKKKNSHLDYAKNQDTVPIVGY